MNLNKAGCIWSVPCAKIEPAGLAVRTPDCYGGGAVAAITLVSGNSLYAFRTFLEAARAGKLLVSLVLDWKECKDSRGKFSGPSHDGGKVWTVLTVLRL